MTKRPTFAIISTENLIENYARLKEKIPEGTLVMGIVKANAYGHGDVEVARLLEEAGCDYFGVAIAEEGVRLREGGVKKPILILGGLHPGQVLLSFDYDLTPVVFDLLTARTISQEALERGVKKKVHIKVDTGMGRLGVLPGGVDEFFSSLKGLKGLEVEGLLSHFAEMEVPDKAFSATQIETFLKVVQMVRTNGFDPPLIHMSNSAAIVDFSGSHLSMIRPGLMLYGSYPAERLREKIELKPVMEFKTRITHLKSVPEGFSVSYGRTFVTERESKIATIPVGYADGLPRRLSGVGEALVNGVRTRIAGVVCMDMTMLDVTRVDGVSVGDEVVLIGVQGSERITVEDVAEKAGTIPYEILCNISPRVPRIYK